jgi:predicted O-linked N-acetylglucosamine transferase (SPINDLY family)
MVLAGMPREGEYDPLIDLFAREGIDRQCLILYSRCSPSSYFALHHQVDMCLDTFPFNGYTVTNHALWMGVPTLTLAGRTAAGRQGAALLGQVGLDAFVARDAADFQAKGLSWAGDLGALAYYVATLVRGAACRDLRSALDKNGSHPTAVQLMRSAWRSTDASSYDEACYSSHRGLVQV